MEESSLKISNSLQVCRVCLEEGDNLNLISNCNGLLLDLNLVNFNLLQNLKYTKDPLICMECLEQLKKLANFKKTIKTNEMQISCHQMYDNNLLLRNLSNDFDKICRLCCKVGKDQYEKNWKDYIKLFVESDILLVSDIKSLTKICSECFDLLKDLHLFNTSCADKEKIIISHFKNKKCFLDSTDLLEVNEIRWNNFFKTLSDDDCKVAGPVKENLGNLTGMHMNSDHGDTLIQLPKDDTSKCYNDNQEKVKNTFLQQLNEDWLSESEDEAPKNLTYIKNAEQYNLPNINFQNKPENTLKNLVCSENTQHQLQSLVKYIGLENSDNMPGVLIKKRDPQYVIDDLHSLEEDIGSDSTQSFTEKYLQNEEQNNSVNTENVFQNLLDKQQDNKFEDCISSETFSQDKSSDITLENNENLSDSFLQNQKQYNLTTERKSSTEYSEKNSFLEKTKAHRNLPVTSPKKITINNSCVIKSSNISSQNYKIEFKPSTENIQLKEVTIPCPTNFLKDVDSQCSSSEDDPKKVELHENMKVVEELTIILDDQDSDEIAEPCQNNQYNENAVKHLLEENEGTDKDLKEIFETRSQKTVDTVYITEDGSLERNNLVATKPIKTMSKLSESTKFNKNDIIYSSSDEEDIVISNSSPVIRKLSLKHNQVSARKRNTSNDFEMPTKKIKVGKNDMISSNEVIRQGDTRYNSQNEIEKLDSLREISGTENISKTYPKLTRIIRRNTRSKQALEPSNKNYTELISKRPKNDKIWEELTGRKLEILKNSKNMDNIEKDLEMDEMVKNIVQDRLQNNTELEESHTKEDSAVAVRTRKRVGRPRKTDVKITYLENESQKKEKAKESKHGYHFCPMCPYKSKVLASFKQHMVIHSVLDPFAKYKCRLCTFQTKDEKLFRGHMSTHLEPKLQYFCVTCGFKANDVKYRNDLKKSRVLQHCLMDHTSEDGTMLKSIFCRIKNLQSDDEYLECIWCPFQSTNSSDFDNHMDEHTNANARFNKNLNYTLLKCPTCGFLTKKKDTMENHLKTCAGAKPKAGVLVPEVSKPLYTCKQCNYITPNRTSLPKHCGKVHRNTPKGPVVQLKSKPKESDAILCCEKCDFITNKKERLNVHLAGKHNPNLVECPHCPFETKHLSTYKRHLKSQHNIIF